MSLNSNLNDRREYHSFAKPTESRCNAWSYTIAHLFVPSSFVFKSEIILMVDSESGFPIN